MWLILHKDRHHNCYTITDYIMIFLKKEFFIYNLRYKLYKNLIEAIVVMPFICTSCGTAQLSYINNQNISYEIVDKGSYSGYDEEAQMWIMNEENWKRCWEKLYKDTVPKPEIPAVNFDRKHLIACFMGSRSKGGFQVSVEQVRLEGHTLHVDLVYNNPGKDCITTLAITQPYIIIAIPDTDVKDITFEVRQIEKECG